MIPFPNSSFLLLPSCALPEIAALDRKNSAELVTDSGLSVLFHLQQGQPPVAEGTRITVTARKYRPRYLVLSVTAT